MNRFKLADTLMICFTIQYFLGFLEFADIYYFEIVRFSLFITLNTFIEVLFQFYPVGESKFNNPPVMCSVTGVNCAGSKL